MFSKLRSFFTRKPKTEHIVIGQLINLTELNNRYIIALARLMFIDPKVLQREANNIKANAEYLLKMIEETNVPPKDDKVSGN